MKLSVLAIDYDGTIAVDGILDPGVRAALAMARERGLAVVLVTGRIVADLERVLGGEGGGRAEAERLFDAIVAENGAVVHFPQSERSLDLGHAPPLAFVSELRHRGVPFLAGDCVVETDADRGPVLLSVLRELELPLCLLFNRGRVMVLPQGISKATGLREALRALRLSPHNALALGDAENDHELLDACEVGVAVAWGSPVLQSAADEVLPGGGPAAVAGFVRTLAKEPDLEPHRIGRRRLRLGVAPDGSPCELAVRGRNVLIAGDTRSGKSWIAGVLGEQLVLQHYCVCVIDPEGEYAALQVLPSVVVFDACPRPPSMDDLVRTLRYPDVSVVVDLSGLPAEQKGATVRQLLLRLRDLRRSTGLPHRIVVDEAHDFLRDDTAAEVLDLARGGYTLVTWHVSWLAPSVLRSAEAVLVTRASDPAEARALHRRWGHGWAEEDWVRTLGELPLAEAVLLPGAPESGDRMVRFRVAPRMTEHVRHRRKYQSATVAPEHAFVFTNADGGGTGPIAHNIGELVAALRDGVDLTGHLRRGDLSHWLRSVMSDDQVAADVAVLEARWRNGELPEPAAAIAAALNARYG